MGILDMRFNEIALRGKIISDQQIRKYRGCGHKRTVKHKSSMLIESDRETV